jgi:hypothetical protein
MYEGSLVEVIKGVPALLRSLACPATRESSR